MQLSSGKKNAPAAVEEERRPRAEAGSGGEMPAMPGATPLRRHGHRSRAVPCRNRRWKFLKAEFRKN